MAASRGNPRMEAGPMPAGVETTIVTMKSADGARVPGVLYRVPGSRTVATLMHPRLDLTRHYLTSLLVRSGISVFTQGTRSVGNDLTLVHEEAVLDAGAGFARVRELGFEHVVAVGASGGGPLYAFYVQQASRAPSDRITHTPGGQETGFATADLAVPDGTVFVAAHPGQGELLLGCIDPAVADESNPRTTLAELDLFDEANGFVAPFESSHYTPDFLVAYHAAQRARVARIDARARAMIAEKAAAAARWKAGKRSDDRRRSELAEVLTIYRTDADPRTVDLSLDPSDRPYGSVQGSRPDVGNVTMQGFGRLSSAEAWLSTWSGLSSNARFVSCAPELTLPTLFVEYTGDQANFPTVSAMMYSAIAANDKTYARARGTHFGGSILADEPPGGRTAASLIAGWIAERFEIA
jgi:hypothetical protein